MWSCEISVDELKMQLEREHIDYIEKQFSTEREYLKTHFRNPNLKGRSEAPVSILLIDGGSHKMPVWLEFQPGAEGMVFYDLYFGEYGFELFQNNDEIIRQTVIETIRDILDGKIHVIASWNSKTCAWNGDASFYISPGEDDDDSDAYEKALRRIEKPRGWFSRRWGVETTYAVYNWNSYCEIKR